MWFKVNHFLGHFVEVVLCSCGVGDVYLCVYSGEVGCLYAVVMLPCKILQPMQMCYLLNVLDALAFET